MTESRFLKTLSRSITAAALLAGVIALSAAGGCQVARERASLPGLAVSLTRGENSAPAAKSDLSSQIQVGGSDALQRRALLRFDDLIGPDAGQIPPGVRIQSAQLTLHAQSSGDGVRLHQLLTGFSADSAWTSFGADGPAPDGREAAAAPVAAVERVRRGPLTVDVTAAVQAWVDGQPAHGWLLLPAGPDDWSFAGFDAAWQHRPDLSVVYDDPPDALVIASGDVDQSSVVLWAKSAVSGPLRFELREEGGQSLGSITQPVTDPQIPAKTEWSGLQPGTRHVYTVSDGAGRTESGQFTTAAPADVRRGLRFGVTGDWRGDLTPFPVMDNLTQRLLDFLVALGDTIYADIPSPAVPGRPARTLEELRAKHAEQIARRSNANYWKQVRAAIPLFATIDDHEVSNNIAGGAPPGGDERFEDEPVAFINETSQYRAALDAFVEYHPIRDERYAQTGADPRMDGKWKLYRYRQFGLDAALFILDARSYRDAMLESIDSFSESLILDQFFQDTYDPSRTLLGARQLADLQRDLLAAQAAGVTWKVICIPQPIQNLGPIGAWDRAEGYAAERDALLKFIDDNKISNVFFIAADIHSTLVNNLTRRAVWNGPGLATSMWETTVGAAASGAPLGPITAEFARRLPLLGLRVYTQYDPLDRDGKDALLVGQLNRVIEGFGYNPIGLQDSAVPARLLTGTYYSLHTYAWTEFEIDAATARLTVTTYGIDWYDGADLAERQLATLRRRPQVIMKFEVDAR